MSIIDNTYFIGELALPEASEAAFTTVWINRYENEYLKKVLGVSFALEFLTAISGTPDTKWADLIDGKQYTVGDDTYEWIGFKDADTHISPIANYVYVMYQLDHYTRTDSAGESVAAVQNSQIADAIGKINRAWVRMKQWQDELYHFLTNNSETYPTFKISKVKCFGSINGFGI